MKSASPATDAKTPRKRVLLVDYHPMMRAGLKRLLHREPDLEICGEADTAANGRNAIQALKPDIVLTEIFLPDATGLAFVEDVHLHWPHILVLVLSGGDQGVYAKRALRSGAAGYLMKHEGPSEVLNAIRTVVSGNLYVSQAAATPRPDLQIESGNGRPSELALLSRCEIELLDLIGRGLTTGEIGRQLGLSAQNVESCRRETRAKLGLNTGADLMKQAVRCASRGEHIRTRG